MAIAAMPQLPSGGGFVRVYAQMSCAEGLRDSMPRGILGNGRSQFLCSAKSVRATACGCARARFLGPFGRSVRRYRHPNFYQLLQIVTASGSGCVRLPYRIPNEVWHNQCDGRAEMGAGAEPCAHSRVIEQPVSRRWNCPRGFPGHVLPARSPCRGNTRTSKGHSNQDPTSGVLAR